MNCTRYSTSAPEHSHGRLYFDVLYVHILGRSQDSQKVYLEAQLRLIGLSIYVVDHELPAPPRSLITACENACSPSALAYAAERTTRPMRLGSTYTRYVLYQRYSVV